MLIDSDDKVMNFGFWDFLCATIGLIVGGVYWFLHILNDPEGNWFAALVAGFLGAVAGALVGIIISSRIPRFVTIIVLLLVGIGVVPPWISAALHWIGIT